MVISKISQLEGVFDINTEDRKRLEEIVANNPFAITPYYLGLIKKFDMSDPVYRMSMPSLLEEDADGVLDSSGEKESTKVPGLQHKYPQTALVLTTNACKMYCRHCFRKRLVGVKNDEIAKDWDKIVNYISDHKEITNVLLSGGDSLVLQTDEIINILERLSKIDHLKFIRLGSRIPVVEPERITNDQKLLDFFKDYNHNKKKLYLTTQFNHSVEITDESIAAVNSLKESGLTVNNQTVLLKGVNDDPDTLAELLRDLTEIGVIPYYVFQCRPVSRVKSIFQVSFRDGIRIVKETKNRLDGYAKRFRYVFSHYTGKIEILGNDGDNILFKYHEYRDDKNCGRIFSKAVADEGWLENI